MTHAEFVASLSRPRPPAGAGKLLKALWHDARGDWQRAHRIVQSQNGRQSALIHAYLHRKEGDAGNARYWYGRGGVAMPRISLHQEWKNLLEALLREEG